MVPVLLYSGGLDSFVLGCDMCRNPFRYGIDSPPILFHFTARDPVHQHCTRLVMEKQSPFLQKVAVENHTLFKEFSVPRPIVVPFDDFIFTGDPNVPQPEVVAWNRESAQNGVTPSRNLIFLSICSNWAASVGSNQIFAAFMMTPARWGRWDQDDPDERSDDNPAFVEAFNQMGEVGGIFPNMTLETPFLEYRQTKSDIIRLGRSLGVPFDLTYSCVWQAPVPCEQCAACLVRGAAFKEVGEADAG